MSLPKFLVLLFTGSSFFSDAQQGLTIPLTASPMAKIEQSIGLSTIGIDYSRPSITSPEGDDRRGKIWGSLVPYGLSNPINGFGSGNPFPWRAGANENTTITFSHRALVQGQAIPAGKYGLHIILNEDSTATLIFSSNISSWGSFFYSSDEDVLRVNIRTIPVEFTERLTFDFTDLSETAAVVVLDWEFRRFPFEVDFDGYEIVYQSITDELRGIKGFGWQAPYEAAQYCADHNIHLDQALLWINRSLESEKKFTNLFLKSELLEMTGKSDESSKTRDEALNLPDASANNWYSAGRAMLDKFAASENDAEREKLSNESLTFFLAAEKKFKEEMLIQYGLTRAYSATGNFKKAIVCANKTKSLTDNGGTKQFVDGLIKKLEAGEDIN